MDSHKIHITPVTRSRLFTPKKYVKVGDKFWSCENARTLHGIDGDLRPNEDYYDVNGEIYYTYEGALKIVPKGWHLPNAEDYADLIKNIVSSSDAVSEQFGGSNASGLGMELLGYRNYLIVGGVYEKGVIDHNERSYIMTDIPCTNKDCMACLTIEHGYADRFVMDKIDAYKRHGVSVRFVKDL